MFQSGGGCGGGDEACGGGSGVLSFRFRRLQAPADQSAARFSEKCHFGLLGSEGNLSDLGPKAARSMPFASAGGPILLPSFQLRPKCFPNCFAPNLGPRRRFRAPEPLDGSRRRLLKKRATSFSRTCSRWATLMVEISFEFRARAQCTSAIKSGHQLIGRRPIR